MLENVQSLTLLTILEIIAPVVLACGLLYGIYMYHTRGRSGVTDRERDQATRAVHRMEARRDDVP